MKFSLASLTDLVNTYLFGTMPARRRIIVAYDEAWEQVGGLASDHTREVLVARLRHHAAPGLADPDAEPLGPWLAAWRDGLDPRAAAARSGA